MASDSRHKKKYRVRKGRVAAAAGILAVVVAAIVGVCVFFGNKGNNDKSGSPGNKNTVNADEISRNGEYIEIDLDDCNLYVGSILRLKCSSQPEEYADKVIWSSSDAEVVSVNGKGDIIVKAEGSAAVTATCGILSDSVIIKAVSKGSGNYDTDLPVYDIEDGKVVEIQTGAQGNKPDQEKNTRPADNPGPSVPTQGGDKQTSGNQEKPPAFTLPVPTVRPEDPVIPTAPVEPGGDEPVEKPTEKEPDTDPELTEKLVSDIREAGFSRYLEDTYIYVESGNYLGEIIVGDSFVQIYVMTRTTAFDASLKRVIMSLLPTGYENVFAQLISAETDRTFSTDGYKVRIVAPSGGGHAQLIIYY